MPTYHHFARFYDGLMNDPLANVGRVLGYRERHMPHAASLLELGCGSGSMLAGLHSSTAWSGSTARRRCSRPLARRFPTRGSSRRT